MNMNKKFYTLVLSILIFALSFGQNIDGSKDNATKEKIYAKKPLIEVFTSSTCPPCASYNPVLKDILDNYPGEYSLIKYQMNWPSAGDPYYTVSGGVRRAFYGANVVPSVYSNGKNGNIEYNSQFESLTTAQSPINLEITYAEISGTKVLVETSITSSVGQKSGLTYHVVLVEKITSANRTTNGEIRFENVMMNILENGYGVKLDTLVAEVPQPFSHEFEMSGTNVEELSDLGIVIFLQDDWTRDVKQSEMAFNIHIVGVQDNPKVLYDIYPSPSRGTFQLSNIENAEVKVFNLGGQLMSSFSNVLENQVLNIHELTNGTYIIHVKEDNKTGVKKLVVAK